MTEADIRNRYDPPLAQEDLHAAWSYCKEHQAEIDKGIRDNEAD